jgi:hypothetical protein
LPDFSCNNIPKREKYTKRPWNMYTKWPQKYQMPVRYIDQMAIEYTNIFHWKSPQNLPKLGYLVWKYAIWQPWLESSDFFKFQPCLQCVSAKKSPSNVKMSPICICR